MIDYSSVNEAFDKWLAENEEKFYRCMFNSEDIAASAWIAGIEYYVAAIKKEGNVGEDSH